MNDKIVHIRNVTVILCDGKISSVHHVDEDIFQVISDGRELIGIGDTDVVELEGVKFHEKI